MNDIVKIVKDKEDGRKAQLATGFDEIENCDKVCIKYFDKNEDGSRSCILLKSNEYEFGLDERTGAFLPTGIWNLYELLEEEE